VRSLKSRQKTKFATVSRAPTKSLDSSRGAQPISRTVGPPSAPLTSRGTSSRQPSAPASYAAAVAVPVPGLRRNAAPRGGLAATRGRPLDASGHAGGRRPHAGRLPERALRAGELALGGGEDAGAVLVRALVGAHAGGAVVVGVVEGCADLVHGELVIARPRLVAA